MKNESAFTKWFCGELEKCNCFVTPIVASEMQPAGIPDRHVMHKSLPQGQVWLEFKFRKGKLRESQRQWMMRAKEHNAHAIVVRFDAGTIYFEDVTGETLYRVGLQHVKMTKVPGVTLRGCIHEALEVLP